MLHILPGILPPIGGNILECSSAGIKHFSAMYARVKISDKTYGLPTIEFLYQNCKCDAQGNRLNKIYGSAKGRAVDHIIVNNVKLPASYLTAYYRYLWYAYLRQHPVLVEYASHFTYFNDKFRGRAINCQADCVRAFVHKDKEFFKPILELIKLTGLPFPAKEQTDIYSY